MLGPLKVLIFLVACSVFVASRASALDLTITYLERIIPQPPTLSNLDPKPEDLGRAGAELGIADISTTAKFLGHTYELNTVMVGEDEDIVKAAQGALSKSAIVVLNAPANDLLTIADLPESKDVLLFNAGSKDMTLREAECRANLLHTIPSRPMLTDALAQFGVKKRWSDWALIKGPRENDAKLADAFITSAKKFGLKITGQKDWTFEADLRRSAAQEVPLFTQDLEEHDLLVVADELNDFARYVQYNTWLARPLAGSTGISPKAWSGSVEQHGAVQLQNRFREAHSRDMASKDYAAMLAMTSIGEAVTRTKSDDAKVLKAYLLSEDFEVGGFKGRPLSFRDWNGQMRQPIPLSHPGAVVALAPLEGFLHQVNELDTLGTDRPNSTCTKF